MKHHVNHIAPIIGDKMPVAIVQDYYGSEYGELETCNYKAMDKEDILFLTCLGNTVAIFHVKLKKK